MRKTALVPVVALLCMVFTGIASAADELSIDTLKNPGPNRLAVTVFDVGQGSCALVSCPNDEKPNGEEANSKKVLMDCGSGFRGTSKKIREPKVSSAMALFNEIMGKEPMEAMFLSHPDEDHVNLVPDFLPASAENPRQVGVVVTGGNSSVYGKNKKFQPWLEGLKYAEGIATKRNPHEDGMKTTLVQYRDDKGKPYVKCGGGESDGIYVLDMNRDKSSSNGMSVVAMLQYGGDSPFRMMFPGDAEKLSLSSIINIKDYSGDFLKVDVALAPHHGAMMTKNAKKDEKGKNGVDAFSKTWGTVTQPSAVIYSAGLASARKTQYGHPRCETVNAYDGFVGSWVTGEKENPVLTCEVGRGKAQRIVPDNPKGGQFSTRDGGAIVTVYDGNSRRTTIYSCPGNNIEECKAFEKVTGKRKPIASTEGEEEGAPRKKVKRATDGEVSPAEDEEMATPDADGV